MRVRRQNTGRDPDVPAYKPQPARVILPPPSGFGCDQKTRPSLVVGSIGVGLAAEDILDVGHADSSAVNAAAPKLPSSTPRPGSNDYSRATRRPASASAAAGDSVIGQESPIVAGLLWVDLSFLQSATNAVRSVHRT